MNLLEFQKAKIFIWTLYREYLDNKSQKQKSVSLGIFLTSAESNIS